MRQFRPTHEIKHKGRSILVVECDGALYTRQEWESDAPADWEVVDGELRFQGEVPAGEHTIHARTENRLSTRLVSGT